ncbi:hypothetical protein ACJIZ3_007631 [Penstemon smallii]|uniref:DC1 domain-containing protein n=1 Tax=Penstemon smallii TaxID=265156 RepID=A0ABD3T7I2_9LAMI
MKHFSHPHELSATPILSTENNDEIPCFGCKLPLFGPLYSCSGCNFYLHKFCFEFPQSIQSKSHPKHSLGLLYPPHCKGDCDACGESCNGFTYNCNLCNYNVHANCSNLLESEPKNENAQYFKTFMEQKLSKLKLLSATNENDIIKYFNKETTIITCSICEQLIPINSSAAYACPNHVCDFVFHKSCFETPRTILNHKSHPDHHLALIPNQTKQCCTACGGIINGFFYGCNCKRHDHPLALRYGTADENRFCDVCRGKVIGCRWSYSCKGCDFDAHTDCAFSADVNANNQELNYEKEKELLRQQERENKLSEMRQKLSDDQAQRSLDNADRFNLQDVMPLWKYTYRYY